MSEVKETFLCNILSKDKLSVFVKFTLRYSKYPEGNSPLIPIAPDIQ